MSVAVREDQLDPSASRLVAVALQLVNSPRPIPAFIAAMLRFQEWTIGGYVSLGPYKTKLGWEIDEPLVSSVGKNSTCSQGCMHLTFSRSFW